MTLSRKSFRYRFGTSPPDSWSYCDADVAKAAAKAKHIVQTRYGFSWFNVYWNKKYNQLELKIGNKPSAT